MALVWTVRVTVAASVVASLTVLAFGLMAGGSRPAWLHFVQSARTVAAIIGCGLIVVGLLHYRDTEPSGEIHWIILGLAILVGSGVVHLWVVRTHRRTLYSEHSQRATTRVNPRRPPPSEAPRPA